jgi:hypothetical protein
MRLKKKNFFSKRIFFSRCKMRKTFAYLDRVRWSKENPETYLLMTTVDEECRGIIERCRDNLEGCRDIERDVNLSRLYNNQHWFKKDFRHCIKKIIFCFVKSLFKCKTKKEIIFCFTRSLFEFILQKKKCKWRIESIRQ